jgi:hypothetical protein
MSSRQDCSDVDIEMDSTSNTRRLEGYPTFAAFIARDRDAAIYRKFEHMSARSLLYLQSELHELEGKLEGLDDADSKSSSFETEAVGRAWHHYNSETNERGKEHRQLQAEIKIKLKEYRNQRWTP